MAKKKDKKQDQWELEAPFDRPASLEELVEAQPFTEAGGSDSVTAGTRIPKWMFRRVAKLTETTGSPYEVASDVYRDAIYLGLRVIFMRFHTTKDWGVESKLAAIAMDTEVMKRTRARVDLLAGGLENLLMEDEPEKATEELSEYVSAGVEMDDEWVKSRMFRMLRENETIMKVAKMCSAEVRKTLKETGVQGERRKNASK